MTLTAPGIGMELIERQALIVLFDHLNDEYEALNTAWGPLDVAFADHLGVPYEPITIEPVENTNFYSGHRPSLISAPPEKYPNCCAFVFRAVPDPRDDLMDQHAAFRDTLAIELMVKGTEEEGEGVVKARISRLADAAHNVIMRNRTLYGLTSEIGDTPTAAISELFTRRDKTSYGKTLLWQGARIEYSVSKVSRLDQGVGSQTTERFLPAPVGIDQA